MWSNGTINGFEYEIKHYEAGSPFGIDGGRISKATLWRGREVVYHYDRGLDVPPADEETEIALAALLTKYN